MNARVEKTSIELSSNDKDHIDKIDLLSDIRYLSSSSGSFLSFAPNVSLPDCIIQPKVAQIRSSKAILFI
jgi:hypothetical protein